MIIYDIENINIDKQKINIRDEESLLNLCRLYMEKKKNTRKHYTISGPDFVISLNKTELSSDQN